MPTCSHACCQAKLALPLLFVLAAVIMTATLLVLFLSKCIYRDQHANYLTVLQVLFSSSVSSVFFLTHLLRRASLSSTLPRTRCS